jgi:two-component system OmpR family sensor kinase
MSLLFLFIKRENQAFQHNQESRYLLISNTFLTKFYHSPDDFQIEKLSKKLNLTRIKNRDKNIRILNNARVIFAKESIDSRVRVFQLKKKFYIYIQSIGYNLMYEINVEKNYKLFIAVVLFNLILLLILMLYFAILKKLRPLKNLHNEIIKFSNGDLGVELKDLSKDEIGQISKSFNTAIKNINQLVNSKNMFMKNILHELKTPITKGLFLSNLIETKNEEDKKSLIKTFNTMNSIINQLSNIEKLKNIHLNIKKEHIDLDLMFEQLFAILDIDKDKIAIKKLDKDIDIIANKELFTTLIKNLVDNALKYSTKDPINIDIKKQGMNIISFGEKLEKPIDYYTQAFIQDKKNSPGFGLGLYIVQEIINLHNFKLEYSYKNGRNIFSVLYK